MQINMTIFWWYSLWNCILCNKTRTVGRNFFGVNQIHERVSSLVPLARMHKCLQSSAESLMSKVCVFQVFSSSALLYIRVSLAHCSIRLKGFFFFWKYLEFITKSIPGYKTSNFHRYFNSFPFCLLIFTQWCSLSDRIALHLSKLIWRRWLFLLLSDSYTLCRKGRVRQVIFFSVIKWIFSVEISLGKQMFYLIAFLGECFSKY